MAGPDCAVRLRVVRARQIDPEPRKIVQIGYNQPLEAAARWRPTPTSIGTSRTSRHEPHVAAGGSRRLTSTANSVFRQCLGEQTDVAVGLAGGASRFLQRGGSGKFITANHSAGHGGEGSVSIYHRVNPSQESVEPHSAASGALLGLRARGRYRPAFQVPDSRTTFAVRAGFRWGGREPLLVTKLAMEISGWYEGAVRGVHGAYGFAGDRDVKGDSHLFWARALLNYTLPESGHQFSISATAGTSVNPDRFSAYRWGPFFRWRRSFH